MNGAVTNDRNAWGGQRPLSFYWRTSLGPLNKTVAPQGLGPKGGLGDLG